jgi:hypothetical protein
MSHLKRIILRNFKSHAKSILNLHPCINVIYGDPQAGKSNILRALELLMYNRPRGGHFLPNFIDKGETEVAIIDSDMKKVGIKAQSHRTKKGAKKRDSTYYYIEDLTNKTLWDATGVGSAVPAEITKAINLTEINLQFQKDAPFLATKSGSKISKTINRITGLDIGDAVIKSLNRSYNEQNAVVKALKADLKEVTTKKKFFTDIKDLQITIKRVKALEVQLSKTETTRNRLSNNILEIEGLTESIQTSVVPDVTDQLTRAKELKHQIVDGQTEAHAFKRRVDQCGLAKKAVEAITLPNVDDLLEQANALVSAISDAMEKSKRCEEALLAKHTVDVVKEQEDVAVKEYLDMMFKLKTCPTCFSSIDKKTLQQIERRIRNG